MNGDGAPSSVVMRWPLDALATCSTFSFWWWGQVSYWGGPVQGATTTMYFGDHRGSSSSFRIYWQPEDSTSIFWRDVNIPAWLLEQGGTCPSQDGKNWCTRSDSVVRAGWVAKDVIGFMWHARQGNGFPFPYIEAATFSESNNLSYLGRPYLWSDKGAWHYPFASPNARGDIGVTVYFSDELSFPSPHFLIFDDYTPNPPPGWEAYRLFNSTVGAPAWGDYVRNRSFEPSQLGWVTGAFAMDAQLGPQPLFYILSRQRDVPSISRYWQD